MSNTRIERDSMGELQVPMEALPSRPRDKGGGPLVDELPHCIPEGPSSYELFLGDPGSDDPVA